MDIVFPSIMGIYINGTICASWFPVGLAFKLSEQEAERLIAKGKAKPLKYFPKGPIKKGYVLFENPGSRRSHLWKKYFMKATKQVLE